MGFSPITPPGDTMLPAGFTVRLSPATHVCDDGRTLVGGTRRRVLRLRPAARNRLDSSGALTVVDGTDARLARELLDRGFADPAWDEPVLDDVDDRRVRDVTVVVPTLDRAEAVDGLLSALPAGVPTIVVDDGSARPLQLAAVCARHRARLVRHEVNRGPAAARNTGLAHVTTEFAAFCDSDIRPEPGWLATLRRHLDDPAVAVVAPRVLGPVAAEDDTWVERYEQARSSLDLGPTPAVVSIGGQVSYLPSACILARVSALASGFDERMRVGEDVDLIWRLVEAQWRVRYEPAAGVRHQHRAEPREWLRRKALYGSSAAELARRHGPAVAPMALRGLGLALVLAVAAQRRWSVPVALAAYGFGTWRTARKLHALDHPVRAAATLALEASVASLWQAGAGLTRHYWPLAAVGLLGSRRLRRAVVAAAVLDGLADYRRTRPRLDPARYVLARRLDDLAYGAGLWQGVLRARSARALLPDFGR